MDKLWTLCLGVGDSDVGAPPPPLFRRASAAALSVALLLSFSCAEIDEPNEGVSILGADQQELTLADSIQTDDQLISEDSADRVTRTSSRSYYEGADTPEVVVNWAGLDLENRTESTASQLRATLQNDSGRTVTAEPVLLIQHRSGGSREQRLPAVTLQPRETQEFGIDVDQLDMQSVGVPSSLTVGVRWDVPGRTTAMVVPNSLSSELHITHAPDFQTAVVRSTSAQRAFEVAETVAGRPPRIGGYRERNSKGKSVDKPQMLADAPDAEEISMSAAEIQLLEASLVSGKNVGGQL